jgi:ABC-type iron transport system FetAB permease component
MLNYPLHSSSSLQARIVSLILVVFFSDYIQRPDTYAFTVIVIVLMNACAEFLLIHLLTEQFEVVTILTLLREVPASNLDRYTD